MLNAMILDTHINDVRCVRRQSQITVSLSNEKNKYYYDPSPVWNQIFENFTHKFFLSFRLIYPPSTNAKNIRNRAHTFYFIN
jgi:hypothetical protein